MSIQRFDVDPLYSGLEEARQGDWVLYEDHVAEVAKKDAEIAKFASEAKRWKGRYELTLRSRSGKQKVN